MSMPTPESIQDSSGTAAALLGAYLADDAEGAETLVASLDLDTILITLGFLVGMTVSLGGVAYGSPERFAAAVAAWTPPGQMPTPDDLP